MSHPMPRVTIIKRKSSNVAPTLVPTETGTTAPGAAKEPTNGPGGGGGGKALLIPSFCHGP
jgi:hypothetical protein